ncbi:hypothetical protein C8Q75DRAFT_803435 [Abortiporus biennis]|nr:hypothetical protein C8Q75DRAFT_803435 [Abortiporus biennis]
MTQQSPYFERQIPFRPSPPTPEEQSNVEMLVGMMGPDFSPELVLNVLRRNAGDVAKAATALLEGDMGQDTLPTYGSFLPSMNTDTVHPGSGPRTPPPSKPERESPPVIDLTTEDDSEELKRALELSIADQGPKFGPSDRAPDPAWAIVPSNVEVKPSPSVSHEQQTLDRAIQESLSYEISADVYDEVPLEERVRLDNRPVILRPTETAHVYAALVMHALFFIPQVRHSVALWKQIHPQQGDSMDEEIFAPTSGPEKDVWTILELFGNMDLAKITDLNVDSSVIALDPERWGSLSQSLGELSNKFFSKLARTIEGVLHGEIAAEHEIWPRLFHFRFGSSEAAPYSGPFDKRHDISVVKVDIRGTPDSNDLLSCLSSEMSPTGQGQQVIFQPSDVVAFQLAREFLPIVPSSGSTNAGVKIERQRFAYPKYIYLDQFLKENVDLANEKRKLQKDLTAEIEKLSARRAGLTRHENRDVLLDLRASLHYYEEVAEHYDDEERKKSIQDTAIQLKKVLTRIEAELQNIDTTIADYKLQVQAAYDCPELQKYRYDLRAVLVHDGLYGRRHLYSYVKHHNQWWKTLDKYTTAVSEDTVLSDAVGLHLDCGPYFLFYSRALSPEDEEMQVVWPSTIIDSVKTNNQAFIKNVYPLLTPEQAAKVLGTDYDYPLVGTPSEGLSRQGSLSSEIVEPPSSREDSTMELV